MKNPTDDDAYHALFRSYELADKEIKKLQAQLAAERERNLNNVSNADLQIAELQAQVAAVTEQRDAAIEAVMGEDYVLGQHEIEDSSTLYEIIFDQIAAAQSQVTTVTEQRDEITRLRAGGCARDQHTTQYCGEMQALVVKLSAIADAWNDGSYDEERNDTLKYCARRLRKAISGKEDGLDPRTPEYGVGFEGE